MQVHMILYFGISKIESGIHSWACMYTIKGYMDKETTAFLMVGMRVRYNKLENIIFRFLFIYKKKLFQYSGWSCG